MARKISSRLKINGTFTAQTPIHVGGYGESFETDMALAKNGNDEFYIPGTSLTGTLRSWFEKAFVDKTDKKKEEETKKFVNEIWGYQDGSAGNASFVLIEDMRLPEDLRNSLQSELRDGVGIDRHYGTAADSAKYDRTILPKGTILDFVMTVEIGEKHDAKKTKAMFGYLLESLQKGAIRLGASKTRGLGKVNLTKIEPIKVQNLDSFSGILSALQNGGNVCSIQGLKDADSSTKPNLNQKLNIEIDWKPKSPLMVKAGYDGIGVDTLPLVSANGKDKVSLVLPGSSVKGAFRAQAERILRTVSGETAKAKKFHEQIQILGKNKKFTKSTELISELFGAKKETTKSNLGLGALSIDDCFAKKQMKATSWQEVEVGKIYDDKSYNEIVKRNVNGGEVEEVTLWQALKKVEGNNDLVSPTKDFYINHHTAIDRFTGAASDSALFSVLKPSPTISWENLNLSLDLSRISSTNQKSALMLLLLVLRDFAENRLPLGFATNRGMGEVKDVSFEITGLYNITYKNGKFDFKDDEKIADEKQKLKTKVQEEWTEWITKSQTSNS
ncbi:MAG: RAMP superfamily CRISPR-associated protein [Pyrinomonadaceae bacterium]